MSRDFAERWSDWANIGLILAATLGVVSTSLAIWTANVKESYLKKDIGLLNREAAKADERSLVLEKSIADANAKAAQANERAESERLARVKIEQQIAPRRLSGEQRQKLLAALATPPTTTVIVKSRLLDPEGADLANGIALTLQEAKWKVFLVHNWTDLRNGLFVGCLIGKQLAGTNELKAALASVGLKAEEVALDPQYAHVPGLPQPDVLYLLVGGKP
jgi:hypothetical protein